MTRRKMLSLTAKTLGSSLTLGFTGHMMTPKAGAVHTEGSPMQKLKVSDNKRFLVKEDRTPFVWIGDTLWVWQKLTLYEIEEYLLKRKEQGFNIVQVRLAGRPNDRTFNSEGEPPFLAKNRHGQYVLTKPNPKYWSYIDKMIEKLPCRVGLHCRFALPLQCQTAPHPSSSPQCRPILPSAAKGSGTTPVALWPDHHLSPGYLHW